jgi:hypothetical protein
MMRLCCAFSPDAEDNSGLLVVIEIDDVNLNINVTGRVG